jgi:hypothetical protein
MLSLLIATLLSFVIWGLIFSALWWGIGRITMAEPFKNFAVAVLVIASVVIVIGLLTGGIAPFPILGNVIR